MIKNFFVVISVVLGITGCDLNNLTCQDSAQVLNSTFEIEKVTCDVGAHLQVEIQNDTIVAECLCESDSNGSQK